MFYHNLYIVKRFTRVEYLAQFLNERPGMYEVIWIYKTDSEIATLLKDTAYV